MTTATGVSTPSTLRNSKRAAETTGAAGASAVGRAIVTATSLTAPALSCTPTVVATGSPSFGIAMYFSSWMSMVTAMYGTTVAIS